jgi:outer membrane protein OmpA-like peptidoglycan-associated protein
MVDGVRDRAALRSSLGSRVGWVLAVAVAATPAGSAAAAEAAPAVKVEANVTTTAAPAASAAASASAAAPASTTPAVAAPAEPWIKRHRPLNQRLEFGVFGGVFLPHPEHELYSPANMSWQPFARVAPAIGARIGYLPLRFLGAEIEASVMPVAIDDDDGGRGVLYAARGHLIAQLPLASVVPFVVLGGGALGVRSDELGKDADLASHFGGGLKVFVHRWVGIRLDVRGTVTSRFGTAGSRIVHPEVLLGLVIPLGLKARDSDGDGLYDPGQRARPVDACPGVVGTVGLKGCPDRDVDMVADPDDRCPDVAGIGERRGCPALLDSDGDGVFDPGQVDIPPPGGDRCPESVGKADYIGCPPPDSDGDGVVDPDDRCVKERETVNGFQDEDGCPDDVPVDVAALMGTLRGINFAFMSHAITDDSRPALDHAVEVMRANPTIRIEIQGHTDGDGDPNLNQGLSRRRAEAVRQYMIAAGVAEARLRAVGHGGDKPLADNSTEVGKAKNRRIELHLIDANDKVITAPP